MLNDGTQTCLIVEPTRELASQIQDEFRELSRNTNLKSVLIIGGKSIRDQMFILNKRPHFIICTPGRLKDIYERRGVNLDEVNNVVLDEVDRMLDMGFIDDIRFIISKLNPERQSLFFSATMSFKSEAVANSLLKNPVKIEVEKQSPQKNVDQDIVRISGEKRKEDVLYDLLCKEEFKRVLVFTRTKRNADKLSDYLYDKKMNVDALHGGKRQSQRTRIINDFKKGNINILIATDVASRGLDVSDITHVVNYDEPECYDDYIHRIGRTGRAGKKGIALTFIDR
jgi:ATP-dependent RNA helicase RhlE